MIFSFMFLATWCSTSGTVAVRKLSWRTILHHKGTISSEMLRWEFVTWSFVMIYPCEKVLIYVFDVESRELEKDLHYYQSCLEAILQVNLLGAKYFGF